MHTHVWIPLYKIVTPVVQPIPAALKSAAGVCIELGT